MSPLEDRRGFLRRISKNIQHIDKQTLLTHLTQEAENHENFLTLLHSLEEGVLIVSPQGEVSAANDSAQKMLGLHLRSEKSFWNQLEDTDLQRFFEDHLPRLSAHTVQTFQVLSPREQNLKVHLHPRILKNPTRHLIELVDLTNPLTPEVERLARNRFEALLRLAGGLAHEIGNPLNAISLHTEILRKQIQKLKDARKDALNETVEIIQAEINRLDRIVRNFLKSTRRGPIRFQMFDFCAILRDVLRIMNPLLSEREIKTDIRFTAEKAEFFLDEERVRSMLMNLIQNAIEAMPQGGRLNISVEFQGRQTLRVLVQDTGKGIAKDDLPHIFEAYFTTKENGSGLGLMFVYDAVIEHGGKIYVESKLKRGTRFEILLPLRRSNLQIGHAPDKKAEDFRHA